MRAPRSPPTAAPGRAGPPPTAELADPAYAEPLLIHIVALLGTVDMPATPLPGLGQDRGPGDDITAAQPGLPVRWRLLRALCERERTRWYELGAGSHLSFNPDLPLADQVVALATLTAAADQTCATSLLAALPNQAEVTRIGAEALAAWAHRLYAGPGYWNPLRPDLLAEQHLADTAELPALAAAAARLAAGQPWEAGLLTWLLAELTRAAPNQPAVRAALNELLTAALPRIVHLAITTGHQELPDLASLALQLTPRPDLAAPLAGQMPEHSVQLAALAATLTGQQVTQDRADVLGGAPDAASRLAASLNKLSLRLADLGRREDALAASEESVGTYRDLAAARPDAFPARPGQLAEHPGAPAGRAGAAGGRAGRHPGGRRDLPGAGRGPPGRVPARPGQLAEHPGAPAGRPGAAGGRAGRDPGSRHHPPGAGRQMARCLPARAGAVIASCCLA